MEGLDSSRVMRGAQALPQRAGETPSDGEPEALKKAIDDAAAVSGGLWLSYLFILSYIGIAAGAVTHVDLLLERPVKLPFLNTELPLLAFFALAPLLLVVTHAHTLAHFVMLGRKASRFHEQLGCEPSNPKSGAAEGDCDRFRHHLPCNIFVQILAGPSETRRGLIGLILKTIAVTTLVIFPVLLLLLLQAQFLPFHSLWISWTQRIALILDILLLWALWPRIFSSPGEQSAARKRSLPARALRFAIAGALSFAALWLSIVIATIPGEWQEKTPAWANPRLPEFWSQEFWSAVFLTKDKKAAQWISVRDLLFTGEINLTTRRRSSPFSNTLVLPGFNLYEGLKIDEPKKLAWKEYLHDLRGRHLEQAVLSQADLTGADLRGAHLMGADLQFTQLRGASLDQAELQGANLPGAELDGAVLVNAHLQGANLLVTWLRGARFSARQNLRALISMGRIFKAPISAMRSFMVLFSKAPRLKEPHFLAPICGEADGQT